MPKQAPNSPAPSAESQRALRAQWPLIQNLFKDVIGAFAASAMGNDQLMQQASALVYKLLPTPLRLVVSEAAFVALCMKGRDQILTPLLAAPQQAAPDAPQSLAQQLELKSRQIQIEEQPLKAHGAKTPAPLVTTVALTVQGGALQGQKWVFDEHETALIGRHAECLIQVPDDTAHQTVSRHHALLEIAPPELRLRDFGSLNGTFVNGEKIGARGRNVSPEAAARLGFPERELHHGDQIRVGDTTFGVEITIPKARPRAASPQGGAPKGKAAKTVSLRDFEIIRELGRGGMGQVFLARDRRNGQEIALKVMLPRVAADEHSRTVFEREIELSKALKHRNVVALHDFGNDGDKFFFTLDFCAHGSLGDWIVANDGVTLGQALIITLQILDGLDYLSRVPVEVLLKDGSRQLANGIVHRDLKPDNVLISEDAEGLVAKIADVGLSKAFDTAGMSGLTMTGQAAGTPVFMPRQQVINFKFAKPEVDVWAAAATLYWMLTAGLPRDFPPRVDPFKVVLSSDPIPIRQRNSHIPAPIAEVIDRALADKPALHYKNARDLSADLGTAMEKLR